MKERLHTSLPNHFDQENIYLLDPTVQHTIEVYCALAQNESENKSHNIKWGIKAGFEQGTPGFQYFACYGYRFDKTKQTLVIVPYEAKVVRMIFDLRSQSFSYGKISDELAKQNILSPTRKLIWSRECIRKMLCNEKYAEAGLLQETYVEDFFTGKQVKNTGKFQRYVYKNNHVPIVSWSVFERVQKI